LILKNIAKAKVIMNIWLINPYGPIPGESWRDYSFTMMAEAFANAGHSVVWWTSNFSHHFKKHRCTSWHDIQVNDKFIVRLVPTPGYKNNIGLGRIMRDIVFAFRTYSRGRKALPPDCILYCESPLTFGFAGQKLAEFHSKPVIFHQMDLWPELFEEAFPKGIRPIVKRILAPVYWSRKKVYSRLDAVTGLAKRYLDVPLKEAVFLKKRPNAIIYNGIDVQRFRHLMTNTSLTDVVLPKKQDGELWAIFAGSLGPSYDILTLLQVAELLSKRPLPLKLIIAGDGPLRQRVASYSEERKTSSLYYVGKLAPEKLAALYSICDIGLCAYSQRSNVEMPDKIYDYTAAGLPVVNSLRGEVSEVIRDNKMGLQYDAGDPQDLLAKLVALSMDESLRKEMGKNSRACGMIYDQHVQHAKLVELVERVCI
jgi:glycosyltransferase involved in cell wall biosynthesis